MPWEVLGPIGTYKIGPKLWVLSKDFRVKTPVGIFTVPRGFITDHASVPRIFWSLIPQVSSELAEGSILHDMFYCIDFPNVPRKFADEALREVAKARGYNPVLAWGAYQAVRLAGGRWYRKSYDTDKLSEAYLEYRGMAPEEILGVIEADSPSGGTVI